MLMSNLSKRIFLIWARAACVLGAYGAIGASVLAAEPAAQGVPLDESRMSPEAALKILLGDAGVELGWIDALRRQRGHEGRIQQVRARDEVDEASQSQEIDRAGDAEGVISG